MERGVPVVHIPRPVSDQPEQLQRPIFPPVLPPRSNGETSDSGTDQEGRTMARSGSGTGVPTKADRPPVYRIPAKAQEPRAPDKHTPQTVSATQTGHPPVAYFQQALTSTPHGRKNSSQYDDNRPLQVSQPYATSQRHQLPKQQRDRSYGRQKEPRKGGGFRELFLLKQPYDHHDYKQELSDLERQLNTFREENRALVDVNQQLCANISMALEARKIAEEASEQIKQSADKMQLTMDNKELYLGPQATDDDISSRYKHLVEEIRTWSINFGKDDEIDLGHISPDTLRGFHRVAPWCGSLEELKTLLQGKQGRQDRRLFVRGWIGLVISHTLMRTLPDESYMKLRGKDRWLDEDAAFNLYWVEKEIFRSSKVSRQEFNDWRALTITLMSRLERSEEEIEQVHQYLRIRAEETVAVVAAWAPRQPKESLEQSLYPIFLEAVQLSQMLRKQRACWDIRYPFKRRKIFRDENNEIQVEPTDPDEFDPQTMEDIDESEEARPDDAIIPVNIFVAPGLFRRGNINGEEFEQTFCIVPTLVRCDRPFSRD